MCALLLKLWSKLLLILKNVCPVISEFTLQSDYANTSLLYEYITFIMNRSEFYLVGSFVFGDFQEDCDYIDKNADLNADMDVQLENYILLLKLSLMYTPRAIVLSTQQARDFTFNVIPG